MSTLPQPGSLMRVIRDDGWQNGITAYSWNDIVENRKPSTRIPWETRGLLLVSTIDYRGKWHQVLLGEKLFWVSTRDIILDKPSTKEIL